jgi:hypothetical protein
MAAANLLALLDDIATVLDDVSVMTKVAAKKTAGLVGDDLAVNAEQVTGFAAERELPVIWAVAKGATINKVVLIPAALLLSAFLPWLLKPLLMLGGTYLAYEGVHKIYHKLFHKKEDEQEKEELKKAFRDEEVDMVEFEKKKINGAIRTDFILSAEIIVLALGAVKTAELAVQLGVLTAIGFGVVVVVYGLVAGIVKIDDLGLKLREKGGAMETIGDALVAGSPKFMKGLGIVGTVAMLLVGGGIYAHNIEPLHHVIKEIAHAAGPLEAVLPMVANGLVGLVVGAVALPVVGGFMKVTGLGGDGH